MPARNPEKVSQVKHWFLHHEPITATMAVTMILSFLNPVTEFFNDRIRENLLRNPLHLSFGCRFVQTAVQSNFKKLTLAYGVHAFVAHFLEGTLNRLAL